MPALEALLATWQQTGFIWHGVIREDRGFPACLFPKRDYKISFTPRLFFCNCFAACVLASCLGDLLFLPIMC